MGFLDKMKQAKDMYGNMKKIQQELDKIECNGSSCGGKIIAVVKGNHHIKSLTIEDSLKKDMLNYTSIYNKEKDKNTKYELQNQVFFTFKTNFLSTEEKSLVFVDFTHY